MIAEFAVLERRPLHGRWCRSQITSLVESGHISGSSANHERARDASFSMTTQQSKTSEMRDDERAIRQVVDMWMAASKTGDLQTVLSL